MLKFLASPLVFSLALVGSVMGLSSSAMAAKPEAISTSSASTSIQSTPVPTAPVESKVALTTPASALPPLSTNTSQSVYRREEISGEVRQVSGSTLLLALADGNTRTVQLPDANQGDFSFLIGKRIVVTQLVCEKPLPKPKPKPEPEPDQIAERQIIIPQRW